MATEAQNAANRRNAQKSTGPRTAEGKARASMNSLKHGIYSRADVIPGEDPADKQALFDAFCDSCHPRDAVELALVRQMADSEWRMLRFSRGEAGLIWDRMNYVIDDMNHRIHPRQDTYVPSSGQEKATYQLGGTYHHMAGTKDHLSSLARYEASIRRSFTLALQSLEAIRRLRPLDENAESNPIPNETPQNVEVIDAQPIPLPAPSPTLPTVVPRPGTPERTPGPPFEGRKRPPVAS